VSAPHFDRRCHGAVADVGVDFYQEIAADDHRLGFRVIDVGGDDCAAARYFLPDEFRCDVRLDVCAERFAGMLLIQVVAESYRRFDSVIAAAVGCSTAVSARRYGVSVFANRDEFHLRRDDSLASVPKLGDWVVCRSAQRLTPRQS